MSEIERSNQETKNENAGNRAGNEIVFSVSCNFRKYH